MQHYPQKMRSVHFSPRDTGTGSTAHQIINTTRMNHPQQEANNQNHSYNSNHHSITIPHYLTTTTTTTISPNNSLFLRQQSSPKHQTNHSQHNNKNKRNTPTNNYFNCSISTLLYAIFFALLLFWISLQFLMVNIHIMSSHTISNSENGAPESSISSSSNAMNDNSIQGAVASSSSFNIIPWVFLSLTNTIQRIKSIVFDHTTTPQELLVTMTTATTRQMEDDYIEIFYLLLFVNVLAMFPSLIRYLKRIKRRNNMHYHHHCHHHNRQFGNDKIMLHSMKDDDTATQPLQHQQQQQQQQKDQIKEAQKTQTHHKLLYHTYLPAYLLATCADWLQGPYKYALYSSYGYTQRDIAHLFVAGYGSGMILGSMIGGLADTYGRKRCCVWYCCAYTLSVLMKHCRCFGVLLIGRVWGGIATSLLFSVFESWLIRAHGERGLLGRNDSGGATTSTDAGGVEEGGMGNLKKEEEEEKWLAKSLSVSMYGSSLVAIGSGIIANIVVERSGSIRPLSLFGGGEGTLSSAENKPFFYIGGYISAFDACLVPLVLCATLIMILWEENYGDTKHVSGGYIPTLKSDERVELVSKRRTVGFIKKHSSWILDDDSTHSTHEEDNTESGSSGSFLSESLSDEESHHVIASHSKNKCNSKVDNKQNERMFSALWSASFTVWHSPDILICCIIGSFFEGAMYIFIFMWTPALTSIQKAMNPNNASLGNNILDVEEDSHADSDLPFGWIFSSFMICCMLGTITFSHLSNAGISASKCLVGVLALAAVSSLAMAAPHHYLPPGHNISNTGSSSAARTIQYGGMLLYEFCIGAYYPAMGTVKGTIVPEDQRAAIYNVFRLPLNFLVLVNLVWNLSYGASFLMNAVLLMVACVLQIRIVKRLGNGGYSR